MVVKFVKVLNVFLQFSLFHWGWLGPWDSLLIVEASKEKCKSSKIRFSKHTSQKNETSSGIGKKTEENSRRT